MDAAAEQHPLTSHWDELTKSDRQVLDVIRRYSVKYGTKIAREFFGTHRVISRRMLKYDLQKALMICHGNEKESDP